MDRGIVHLERPFLYVEVTGFDQESPALATTAQGEMKRRFTVY